jgi:hypothetical protein
MAELERDLIDARLRLLGDSQRRFRINAGQAWAAAPKDTLHPSRPMTVRVMPGDVILRRARVFHGAPKGWPDLCGWDSIVITPEMVGQTVAVFVGEEFKTPHVRMSPEQGIFRDCLTRMGGRFEVMR